MKKEKRRLSFEGVNVNLDSPEFKDKEAVDNWSGFEHLSPELQKEGKLAINVALGFVEAPKPAKPTKPAPEKPADQS